MLLICLFLLLENIIFKKNIKKKKKILKWLFWPVDFEEQKRVKIQDKFKKI